MSSLIARRAISIYLAAVAVAVAVQFVIYPLYAYDEQGETIDVATDVWFALDGFMAAGLLLMLITTLKCKRDSDANPKSPTRQWIETNLMFYGTVMLTLAFIPNWFAASWGHNADWTIWHVIDTVLPTMFVVQALHLWTKPASD